jgi:quinol monooxygenase YgiN
MARQTVTVVARVRAKAGREKEVRDLLLALIKPTSAEKGCISYDLHQSEDDEGLFLFYENWLSREALSDHLGMPYLQAFLARSEELLAEPVDVSLWKMIC